MTSKHREDIVNIRAIAIMLVALGHSIIIYSSTWNLYQTSVQAPVLDHLKNIVNMLQMPLFFSVSGFCLVYTLLRGGEGRLEARAFIRNKCSRILLPFLIIGFLWLLPIRFALNYPNYRNLPLWKVVLKECLWGSDNGHLWFLPTLFLMFMLTLVLITICGTGARLDIVMAVIGVIALGLYGTARQTVSWNTYLLQFSNYYLFFALGFIYHRNERLLHKQLRHTTVPIIPKPLAAIVLAGAMAAAWFKPATPILLLCSCLSVLAVYIITPQHSTPFMRFISKDSMGIYLFHSPMLYISFTFWPDINPLLMILINFIGFGSIAIGMTELMRHLHLGFIIGE